MGRVAAPRAARRQARPSLARAGAVTFASAAALTLGVATVPVYEIYKAGLDAALAPRARPARRGDRAARPSVIPHYDNAEGGHHDTRFCYLGERRLAAMERELPDDAFVLGVDEHTAVVLDLDAGRASVLGLGGVTVRRRRSLDGVPTGTELTASPTLGAIPATGVPSAETRDGRLGRQHAPKSPNARGRSRGHAAAGRGAPTGGRLRPAPSSDRDAAGAVKAVLELDQALVEWSADTLQSDEPDRARATLRSMIVRLGQAADARSARSPPGHRTARRGSPDGTSGGQGRRGLGGRRPDARRIGGRRRRGADTPDGRRGR